MPSWKSDAARTLLFVPGTSPLHRINPLTKVAALLWVFSAAAIAPTMGTALLTVAGVLVSFRMGVGRPVLGRLAIILVPMAVALGVIHGVLIARPDAVALGPLSVSARGLAFGAGIFTRISTILTGSLLFVTTTHPADLLKALDARGLSPGLSYLIAGPLLHLDPLSVRAGEIRDAQQARGLDLTGSLRARALALPALLIPLITLALTDLDHRTSVLSGRAFRAGKRRTVLDPPADSRRQRWFRRAIVAVALAQLALIRFWR